jgi:hypothetical protein
MAAAAVRQMAAAVVRQQAALAVQLTAVQPAMAALAALAVTQMLTEGPAPLQLALAALAAMAVLQPLALAALVPAA